KQEQRTEERRPGAVQTARPAKLPPHQNIPTTRLSLTFRITDRRPREHWARPNCPPLPLAFALRADYLLRASDIPSLAPRKDPVHGHRQEDPRRHRRPRLRRRVHPHLPGPSSRRNVRHLPPLRESPQ